MMTSKQLSVQVNGSFMTSPLKGNTDQLTFPVRLHLKNSLIRRDGLVDMFIKIVKRCFLYGMRRRSAASAYFRSLSEFIIPFADAAAPASGRVEKQLSRKAHNLEIAGAIPASATRAAVSPVTLSTAASAAMQAAVPTQGGHLYGEVSTLSLAVPTQGGHLRGEVGTLSLHHCKSITFSKIFFKGREPELQLGLICTQSYAIKDMLALWQEAPSRRGL